jgi:putative DNA primase/helicase
VTDDLHFDVAAAIRALRADPDLFARAGALVRVVRGDADEPIIAPHTTATLRPRLTMFARWTKIGESGDVETCIPPDAIVNAVLEAREWAGIRVLAGIAETPTMRPDRTILQRAGYDPDTRMLYLPGADFDEVPDEPTRDDACNLLRFEWVETSYDFPFRGLGYADPATLVDDPDGVLRFIAARDCPDAWGIISAIGSIVARPAISGDVPAIVFDAATPGSGKGLQVDVVGLSTYGRIPEKFTWPNQGDRGATDTEVAKMLAGAVVDGSQLIVWDEVLGAFGGPPVNNVLTCRGRTKLRIIGTPNTPALPYTAVMLGAGNNITARDNTHRRVLVPRLESPDEDPSKHEGWRRPDLRASVAELRPRLVVAMLTVIRAYVVAGMPNTYERNGAEHQMPAVWGGGFEDWTRLVVHSVLWAGGGNVLGCRPTDDPEARNEERDAIAAVIESLGRLEPKPGEGLTSKSLVDLLFTRERIKGEDTHDDGHNGAREAIEELTDTVSGRRPDTKKLGDKLFLWKRRNVGGKMLIPAAKDRSNARRWTVRKVG